MMTITNNESQHTYSERMHSGKQAMRKVPRSMILCADTGVVLCAKSKRDNTRGIALDTPFISQKWFEHLI